MEKILGTFIVYDHRGLEISRCPDNIDAIQFARLRGEREGHTRHYVVDDFTSTMIYETKKEAGNAS